MRLLGGLESCVWVRQKEPSLRYAPPGFLDKDSPGQLPNLRFWNAAVSNSVSRPRRYLTVHNSKSSPRCRQAMSSRKGGTQMRAMPGTQDSAALCPGLLHSAPRGGARRTDPKPGTRNQEPSARFPSLGLPNPFPKTRPTQIWFALTCGGLFGGPWPSTRSRHCWIDMGRRCSTRTSSSPRDRSP